MRENVLFNHFFLSSSGNPVDDDVLLKDVNSSRKEKEVRLGRARKGGERNFMSLEFLICNANRWISILKGFGFEGNVWVGCCFLIGKVYFCSHSPFYGLFELVVECHFCECFG